MTNLDTAVSHAFASLNGISPGFDAFVLMLTSNALLKGGVMVALLWFAWFSGNRRACRARSNRNRSVILSILLSCMAAELLSRILSNSLPFRPRPLLETSLPFRLPAGVTLESLGLSTQSSFPSDHGVLFFALAAGICLVCRRAGLFAFAWASIVIALPRLYIGLHYLSDLVVGALIGITIALVGAWLLPRTRFVKTAVLQARTHPACFYPVFFLAMFQLATMLADLRSLMVLVRLHDVFGHKIRPVSQLQRKIHGAVGARRSHGRRRRQFRPGAGLVHIAGALSRFEQPQPVICPRWLQVA